MNIFKSSNVKKYQNNILMKIKNDGEDRKNINYSDSKRKNSEKKM